MTAEEYRRRAEAHRPSDPEALAREARRLAASGLKPHDVAQALKLSPVAAAELLRGERAAA